MVGNSPIAFRRRFRITDRAYGPKNRRATSARPSCVVWNNITLPELLKWSRWSLDPTSTGDFLDERHELVTVRQLNSWFTFTLEARPAPSAWLWEQNCPLSRR
jgi:hypothetical protein